MADPAIKRMSLDEFLWWEDGTDTRYELIDGFPVAMAPPARAHGILCARLGGALDAALRPRRPCTVQIEAGIARRDREDNCYIADLAVTCQPYQRGEQLVQDPILIIEILSPGTERHDRRIKVPAYREMDSVREILLIDSESIYAEIFRQRDGSWFSEVIRGPSAELYLSSIELRLPMAELYEGIEVEPDTES
ncbi:MAG TPA: Uma2 family endonuclease [Stellaceae bacterium]|nr:Uma2 family endonuclease [Stellaceae bacterium]